MLTHQRPPAVTRSGPTDGTVIGAGLGPAGRISLQQFSNIKWSIALKDGYFLYVNVPKTELDETSLNLLLEKSFPRLNERV